MDAPARFCIRRNDDYLSLDFNIRTGAYSVLPMPRPFARMFKTQEDAERFRDLAGEPDDVVEIYY